MDDISYLGASNTICSYNLFTYCKNNSIMHVDEKIRGGYSQSSIINDEKFKSISSSLCSGSLGGTTFNQGNNGTYTKGVKDTFVPHYPDSSSGTEVPSTGCSSKVAYFCSSGGIKTRYFFIKLGVTY